MPPSLLGFTDDVMQYEYDPDKARALLAEGGFSEEGTTLTIEAQAMRVAFNPIMLTIVQEMWAEVGVDLQIEFLERAALREKQAAGDLTSPSSNPTRAEVDAILDYFRCQNLPPGPNMSFYQGPCDAINDQSSIIDPAARVEALQVIQRADRRRRTHHPTMVSCRGHRGHPKRDRHDPEPRGLADTFLPVRYPTLTPMAGLGALDSSAPDPAALRQPGDPSGDAHQLHRPTPAAAQPTLFFILFALGVFALLHIAPGDPVELLVNSDQEFISEEQRARIRADLGLDQPLPLQFINYAGSVLRGDLGTSFRTRLPVIRDIRTNFVPTIHLALGGMLVAVLIGLPAGIISAYKPNTPADYVTLTLSMVGLSAPSFWIGILLIYLFAYRVPLLPMTGGGDDNLPSLLRHLLLPSLVTGASAAALLARLMSLGHA